jgi:hypothetical protein
MAREFISLFASALRYELKRRKVDLPRADCERIVEEVLAKMELAERLTRPAATKPATYWLSPVGELDDFGDRVAGVIIDGKTKHGSWALMTPHSWSLHGIGQLGIGLGQRFERQTDGKWLKVEG